jgi:cytidyltransferase-like protein
MLKKQFGYFHGRFQPFHNGHLGVVKIAIKKCDLLVIGISNPFRMPPTSDNFFSSGAESSLMNARSPKNNPWPYWARLMMIREGLQREGLDLTRFIFIPNLNNSNLPVNEIRFPKELTVIFVSPKEAHNRDIEQKYKNDGWEVIDIPKQGSGISSREVRKKIRTNLPWEHLVPVGTAFTIKALSPYKFLD